MPRDEPDTVAACGRCLARSWLLGRLAAHLEPARARIHSLLALDNEHLVASVGGERAEAILEEFERFDPARAREDVVAANLEVICRCSAAYPDGLRDLAAPPSTLYVAGGVSRLRALLSSGAVAVVGARRASSYGVEVARSLGRGLSAAEIAVISGMAFGIDSAAHAGALERGGNTVAVLPGATDRPYPAAKRALHRQICASGAAVSELPPGTAVWRWMFPARNRIIAGLAPLTVVVEAAARSGALLTARIAGSLGRTVAAVPGHVTAPLAAGPNQLLAGGAHLVADAQDVLDLMFGAGVRRTAGETRPALEPQLSNLLSALADGVDAPRALIRAGFETGAGLAALASLEIAGYVRRGPGGRFAVVP